MDVGAKPVGNLTPRAASKRLLFGTAMLMLALAVAVLIHELGASHWWRLSLFLPFKLAASGVFMGLYRT